MSELLMEIPVHLGRQMRVMLWKVKVFFHSILVYQALARMHKVCLPTEGILVRIGEDV